MMEFWHENQGQSHLYSRFGTVPGRNCTHNYHDRHQGAHYPLYYGEQQDQSRESSYWTVPGSRTGGALHDYSSWTDPELTASSSSSSSHFPFILDRHTQHHQDLGDYQPHEARDREWTAAQQATRDYERGFLREGWQRRWEPCSPVRYKREVSTKRSDSSYRELEAWAARYSHSLPMRRCIEAELRGTSQGLVGSSRAPDKDSRSGTDAQVSTLRHVRQSANIREPGLWDIGDRQQATNYYPPQAPAPDTSHALETKQNNTGYQMRLFSQPPGYIAPPPYDSPHKSSPVMQHCNSNWEQDAKRQTYWSQPTLGKQDVNLQNKRKVEKEEFSKPEENKTCTEPEVLKHQVQEADTQCEGMSPVQHPQEVQPSKIIKETSSQVIEGRKFRLNKKTGGMTIFCLVSRIAAAPETPSLPQTNIQSTETAEVSKAERDASVMTKLADEVDFRASALTEQTSASHVQPTCTRNEMFGDDLLNKAGVDDFDSTCGRQVGQSEQPVSVKYPLWREPSFTSRAETSSTGCLKENSEEEEADVLQNRHDRANVSNHPIDIEVRRLDIKEDTEDSEGLLIIDTTCVVVKMELIPSPKKEQVHYLGSTVHDGDSSFNIQTAVSPEVHYQLNQHMITDQQAEAEATQMNESPDTDFDSKEECKGEDEISLTCMLSSPIPERETLEERAERILGIPLHDCITEQQPEDETLLFDSCAEEQDEEAEPSPKKKNIHDANKQTLEDPTDEEQNPLEVIQTEDTVILKDNDGATNQVNETSEDFAGSQRQVSDMSAENDTDSQVEKDVQTSTDTETPLLESAGEEGTGELDTEVNQPAEDDQSPQLSDFCHSSMPSPSDLTSALNNRESNSDEDPDPALNTAEKLPPLLETSPLPPSPLHQLPSPLPLDSFQTSTPHTDHSPSTPPCLNLIDETAKAKSAAEDDEGETSHLTEYEINTESFTTDTTEEAASHQQHEPDDDEQVKQELDIPKEQAIEVNVLQQQLECVQEQRDVCVKESNSAEEQPPEEVSEDHTGISVPTSEIDEENVSQTEVNLVQQQFDCGQEEDASEDTPLKNPDEPSAGFGEQTISKNIDLQMEINMLQDTEPSASDCEVSPLDEQSLPELSCPPQESPESDIRFVSLVDSVRPSPLNPDTAAADIQQTVSPPLHLDSVQLSSLSDSPPVLPPSSAPDFLPSHKEEPQYPKSLWDVVNRIRKHTAPDSENEEEEVSELWDPENVGEDLGCPNEMEIAFDDAERQEVDMMNHKELSGQADEDTLSCSSTSSHGSGDTVIVADEDEAEEVTLNVVTESKTDEENGEFNAVEKETCCSEDVKDETIAEEENDEEDTNRSVPVEKTSARAEMSETQAL